MILEIDVFWVAAFQAVGFSVGLTAGVLYAIYAYMTGWEWCRACYKWDASTGAFPGMGVIMLAFWLIAPVWVWVYYVGRVLSYPMSHNNE